MKLVIGVCDDDVVQVETISNFLEQNITDHQLTLIKAFRGEELLSKLVETIPNILFLDIGMQELNGLQLGKRIRDKHPEAIIVFVTGYRQFSLEAFKLRSVDYILKPITEKRFKPLLQELLVRVEQIRLYEEKNKSIAFRFRENIIRLKFNEIYFFEKYLRKITVFSEKGEFSFYESMDKLLGRLDLEQFIQCHNSYIVNVSKITEIKNDCIYIREFDKSIPISRKKKSLVRGIVEKNLFS